MIKFRITQIFAILLVITSFVTFIVSIAWLFDATPINLIRVWKFLGSCLAVSFLLQLLFGAPITFK